MVIDTGGYVRGSEDIFEEEIRKQVEMAIEDPLALTAPWVVTKRFNRLESSTRVYDYACNENNRNPVDQETGWTYTIGPDGKIMDKLEEQ